MLKRSVADVARTIREVQEFGASGRFEALALAMSIAAMQFLPFGHNLKIIGYAAPRPILIVLMALALGRCTACVLAARAEMALGQLGRRSGHAAVAGGFGALFGLCRQFGKYDKTFGSLGAVVVLLTWLYISAYVVLLGACLNAEMERQTERDTTEGGEKPMGARGAKMADTAAREAR